MSSKTKWNWETGKQDLCNLTNLRQQYQDIQEILPSADGEQLAVQAVKEDGEQTACLNGSPWPVSFEKLWYLRFSANGKLSGLGMNDYEWALPGSQEGRRCF